LLPYKEARESEEEKHICPLQLDVIERCLTLWSNPADVILTPFMGIGSEVYGAIMAGRKAVGIELKSSYFRQAKRNLEEATKTPVMTSNEMNMDYDDPMDSDVDSEEEDIEL
jgi:DNA modification methylase